MKITITLNSTENGIKSTCSTEQIIEHCFDGEEKIIMKWLVASIKEYTTRGGINGMLENMNKENNKRMNKDPTKEWNNGN